jgi:hypothetical protein
MQMSRDLPVFRGLSAPDGVARDQLTRMRQRFGAVASTIRVFPDPGSEEKSFLSDVRRD